MNLAFCASVIAAAGCGDVDTGGQAVSADLVFETPGGSVVDAGDGWSVTLTTAQVLVGPVFLLDAAPLASIWSWLSPEAVAHVPASGGSTVGEWIGQVSVDLLSGEDFSLGLMGGQTGRALSAEIQLLPPGTIDGVTLDAVPDAAFVLEGTATRGDESVPFRFAAAPEGTAPFAIQNILTDIPMQPGVVVSIGFDLQSLFANVAFDGLIANGSAATEPVELTESTAAGASLRASMGSRFVWRVSLEAGP